MRGCDEIRSIHRCRERYVLDSSRRLTKLRMACEHRHVVVLESKYEGSRSCVHDHDDAHEALRLCVDCGIQESGPVFGYLLNPSRRFEFGGSKFREKLDETPLGQRLLSTPQKEVLAWVAANGYQP